MVGSGINLQVILMVEVGRDQLTKEEEVKMGPFKTGPLVQIVGRRNLLLAPAHPIRGGGR